MTSYNKSSNNKNQNLLSSSYEPDVILTCYLISPKKSPRLDDYFPDDETEV